MVIFKVRLKPVGHFFAVGQRPSPEMIFQTSLYSRPDSGALAGRERFHI